MLVKSVLNEEKDTLSVRSDILRIAWNLYIYIYSKKFE